MRNYLTIIFVLILFNVFSQSQFAIKSNFGLSKTISSYTSPLDGYDFGQMSRTIKSYNQPTFSAGVFYKKILQERLELVAEINFSQLISKRTMDAKYYDELGNYTNSGVFEFDEKWSYINLPISLGMDISGFSVGFGPQFSILLSGKGYQEITLKTDGSSYSQNTTYIYTDKYYDFNIYDIGIRGYIMYVFNRFIFEVQLNQGILDIWDNDYWTLRNFNSTVGIGFILFQTKNEEI